MSGMSAPARSGSRAAVPGASGVLAPLAALAAALVLLLWATGNLAALLVHGHRPRARLDDMGAVAVRLAGHPGDPAAAWPPADRALLPGPVGFYATLTVLAGIGVGLAVVGWRTYQRHAGTLAGRRGQGASWASRRDLRELAVRRGSVLTGRIVLGQAPWRATIAAPRRHSLLVFGPTLSGKTSSFVIPTILRWRGPVIATSSKVDMLLATVDARQRRGRVMLLDPFGAAGLPAVRWSPLVGARHWADALDMAYWLTQAGSVAHSMQNAEFWETLARTLLGPLLYAAANKPAGTMLDVVAWANEYDRAEEVLTVLDELQERNPTDPAPRLAASALLTSLRADTRRRDSIFGTAQVLLDVYRYPAVAHLADGCDIDREAFLRGFDRDGAPVDNTVFIYSPEHRQDQLRPLIEAFVSWLVRGVEDRYALTGLALDPPLLLMLDEAGNIAPLRKLGTYASSLASQGAQLVAVFQNYAQIRDRYGNQAGTIVTNFLTKVLMAGTTDRELLDLLTHLLGKQELPEESVTFGPDGSRTATAAIRQRDLVPVHELVQQRPGQALALLSHRRPTRLRVRQHTELREFRALLPAAPDHPLTARLHHLGRKLSAAVRLRRLTAPDRSTCKHPGEDVSKPNALSHRRESDRFGPD